MKLFAHTRVLIISRLQFKVKFNFEEIIVLPRILQFFVRRQKVNCFGQAYQVSYLSHLDL